MSNPVPVRLTTFQWVQHFIHGHKLVVRHDEPSVEEMLKYPDAFARVKRQHDVVHARFHTGHEHDGLTGLPIDPPKKKPLFEVVDD